MGVFTDNKTEVPLNSASIAGIWTTYMADSASRCIFKHFLNHVDDKESKDVLQDAVNLADEHIKTIQGFLKKDNIPIPDAFGDDDVDINAPRLFTDIFYLYYLSTMTGFGIDAYSLILRYTSRSDIFNFFISCIDESTKLLRNVTRLRLKKGEYITAPRVEVSKKISYIEKENFLGGLMGKPRPLLAREVTNVFAAALYDIGWRGLTTGFSQVTKSKQVKDFMIKSRELASAHFAGFSQLLNSENIPVPSLSDTFVTGSTVSPFSDKLMMFQSLSLCAFAMGIDGAAVASSMRSDLITLHTTYGAEIVKLAAEGSNIMINNGWMEQPPQVVRSEELATV